MKVHRYSEQQRRLWVHEMTHKTKTIKAICTEAHISRATLYNWLTEFSIPDKKKDDEPVQMASLLPWQPNDKYKMLLSALVKTDADKTVSRKIVRELIKRYNLTTTQACGLVSLAEEEYKYRPRKPEAADKDVYAALAHLLEEDNKRSLEDCAAILQKSHPHWAVKQIKRIYRQGRLYLKRTRIRKTPFSQTKNKVADDTILLPAKLQREAAFWHLGLIKEERRWLLFLLDYEDGTPLNAMAGDAEINESDVMQLIKTAAVENGLPKKIRLPATAPFASRELSKWSWENKIALHNLSMAKAENNWEADYIKDNITKQLNFTANTSIENLQTACDGWLASFAQNGRKAVNYFVKETVV